MLNVSPKANLILFRLKAYVCFLKTWKLNHFLMWVPKLWCLSSELCFIILKAAVTHSWRWRAAPLTSSNRFLCPPGAKSEVWVAGTRDRQRIWNTIQAKVILEELLNLCVEGYKFIINQGRTVQKKTVSFRASHQPNLRPSADWNIYYFVSLSQVF